MKGTGLCLVGCSVLIIGVLAALGKAGALASIGTGWTPIGLLVAIGLGIMTAVTHGGTRENIEIERKQAPERADKQPEDIRTRKPLPGRRQGRIRKHLPLAWKP